MTDIIVVGIIAGILGCAIAFIIKEKKAGKRCIGCSQAGMCSAKCESDVNPLVQKYRLDSPRN